MNVQEQSKADLIAASASRTTLAADRIRGTVTRTRVVDISDLAPESGVRLYAKMENEQETGSFKFRGASNKILGLSSSERERGVVTASNGNHGLGLALAARKAGIAAEVFVSQLVAPERAARIEAAGATATRTEGQPLDAEKTARVRASETGRTFIAPYNDPDVMAGQGTAAFELLEQLPSVDAVFITCGGGGLIGGMGAYIKHVSPATQVISCQPENSRVMYESLRAGQIIEFPEQKTYADSSAGGIEEGSVTFAMAQAVIDSSILVTEEEILQAMRLLLKEKGWLVEGSAAVALAAFLKTSDQHRGKTVAIVLCGSNVSDWVKNEL